VGEDITTCVHIQRLKLIDDSFVYEPLLSL
jgi:hypothetical protein